MSRGITRIDLHCHSVASTEADEAVLNLLKCPECYSDPAEVYAQAKQRGMDFVTITDHDTINGVHRLLDLRAAEKAGGGGADVLVGEELTCYFPEDGCKMHVLIWGISRRDHEDLQAASKDIYECARIIETRRIAHAVAHPVYRQNDLLERWHLERLMLMFKGFECLNGAHSVLHRQAFEPMLDKLTPELLAEYSRRHAMTPRWPEPHLKARTGGSDDHGLFNIGRTWTEFDGELRTLDEVLEALRTARCRPGGEAGSAVKLAHNFLGVGIRYWTRSVNPTKAPTLPTQVLQLLVGDRKRLRRRDLAKLLAGKAWSKGVTLVKRVVTRRPEPEPTGMDLLMQLFLASMKSRVPANTALMDAYKRGMAPLGEHDAMWSLVGEVNRDVARGLRDAVERSVKRGQFDGIFDTISAVAGHQFLMLPYYFALFHQNRERADLHRVTGTFGKLKPREMKVAVFTDSLDEPNGVSRFVKDMAEQAHRQHLKYVVATQSETPDLVAAWRKNFVPLVTQKLPGGTGGRHDLSIPPVAEIMEWADREQFDAVHVDTPGPMGVMGVLVASMLKVPVVGSFHSDFPRLIYELTGDYRLTSAAAAYCRWFWGNLELVMARSRGFEHAMDEMDIPGRKRVYHHPVLDTGLFNTDAKDDAVWARLGVASDKRVRRLLYVGRLTAEKNILLLSEVFRRLCAVREDVELVVCGEGPLEGEMRKLLKGKPVRFLQHPSDETLAAMYASADVFVFPGQADALGQVVLEAQACGLPAIVASEGGAKDLVSDNVTGRVLKGDDAGAWTTVIDSLLEDHETLARMSRTAAARTARYSLGYGFEQYWQEIYEVASDAREYAVRQKTERASHATVIPSTATGMAG
jgi:glycosyltransferase involved in cell wall biosynthesis